jgi:hypothetical protein
MFKVMLLVFVFVFPLAPFACNGQQKPKPTPVVSSTSPQLDYVNDVLVQATAELYVQSEIGLFKEICTTSAIASKENTYLFVSASHCVSSQKGGEERNRAHFVYVRKNLPDGSVLMIPAQIAAVGCQICGDDFSLFVVETSVKFALLNLGDDPSLYGEPVWNMAAPAGRGLKLFEGIVSNPILRDRPIMSSDIDLNWEGMFSIQLYGTQGGSSGSPVICKNQKAVCGILVGTMNEQYTAVVPVSRLRAFIEKWVNSMEEEGKK